MAYEINLIVRDMFYFKKLVIPKLAKAKKNIKIFKKYNLSLSIYYTQKTFIKLEVANHYRGRKLESN